MKRMTCLTMLTLSIVGGAIVEAQNGSVALWTNRFNGAGNGDDFATAAGLDTNGNLFVTGHSAGSGSSSDYVTIKYSGAGVPLWTNRYNGPGNDGDYAYDTVADRSGDVFVTGESQGASSADLTTIKYSGAGAPLWTNRYNGPANSTDGGFALALDTNGNLVVTGRSQGAGLDYVTIKYSGGGVPLWTNRYNGPGNGTDHATAAAVDGSGDVFVTGLSSSSSFSPDYATIKYSGAGAPLWTNRYNGPGNEADQARAMAVDIHGNVLVTGYSRGMASGYDYATIKYSGAGVPLWTNRYDGAANDGDFASAVTVDGSGNVFVTGASTGEGSSSDYVTIKYSSAGEPWWTNRYNGPGNAIDEATALALDTSGNVFVAGYSYGSNGWDYATIAYSGAGVPLWTNRSVGPGDNPFFTKAAVAVDRRGNVFLTGYLLGAGSGYDYVAVKYSAMRPSLTVVRTMTNTVAVSWPSSSDFTLQQNTNGIATVNWSNVVTVPTDNGTTKTVIVNPPSGTRYYRLSSP